ncbi:hypothetical protein RQM65_03650 [Pricia sp. S334]|uniref:Uncharacterized protein n=1 Tax=Pricia mediterranea TaxID=3076079 RepID=A0ABU3L2Y6_9FLAO|nr:hypothetical protein [Pricia sp. S334]MDT7827758.1 hypothetical protein [Pricia sp. S334]
MPDFIDIRENLNAVQKNRDEAKHQLFLKKEKLKRIQREKERLQRGFDPDRDADNAAKQRLEQREKRAKEEARQWQITLEEQLLAADDILAQYDPFSDPREFVDRLSDDYPFLLMPVRIETRFKKVVSDDRERHQLWVRIYPDDCAVDSFESVLSESEVRSAQKYWHGIWQAGGREAMERTAWRALVATYGSGRARYITEQYKPINTSDQPQNVAENDFFLSIAVEELPPQNEAETLTTFWADYWLAHTDKQKQEDAYEDLEAEVGAGSAADILKNQKPANFDDKTRVSEDGINVKVLFIQFPNDEEVETKQQSWSQAPKTNVMPDRFVVTGYQGSSHTNNDSDIAFQVIGNQIPSPLIMGPDPSLEDDEQLQQEDGNLKVNDDLKWMVDFDEAVLKGLGFKINLTDIQAVRGFDRIVALGLKLSADEQKGSELLETLFKNHENSKKGFTILPQGTPTNNTEEEGSGHDFIDDADTSFDHLKHEEQFSIEHNWLQKKDGQWLAEWLGVDYHTFQKTYNAALTDQREAKAMNIALFPATMGYMMETMMQEVFSDDDMEKTRWFMNNFVSGRGPVPAIKIGNQPYGILPATTFSDLGWLGERRLIRPHGIPWTDGSDSFLRKLYQILQKFDTDFASVRNDIAFVGKDGEDAHQLLLDIVGLNPVSVEFYQRYAESYEAIVNRFKLHGGLSNAISLVIAGFYATSGMDLLRDFGHKGDEIPDILEKIFLKSENKLYRDLIDDRKLSETEPIRSYTPEPDAKNYIEWLIEAANTSHDTLRKQQGFLDNKIPTALLYLMLKHSLDMGYINVSLDLNLKANRISTSEFRAAKLDPAFMHVQPEVQETESKWKYLYRTDEVITGSQNLSLGDYIPTILNTELATAYLREQLNALQHLAKAPTARLERAFTEHIDLCTYRLDAWKNGFMNYQLAAMRFRENIDSETPYQKGTYLGAYGWLEDIRPENKVLEPKNLEDPELKEHFNQPDEPQLMTDATNGGFITAPSLNHAVTAAILRNAYMSDDDPETFEINLSSERVRKALSLIEGVRSGQSLSALLGYYLERELHDQNTGLTLIDFHIHKLRKAFPFRADKLKDTRTEDTDAIEAIEASNVVDGLGLIEHIKETGNTSYPFGKENILKTSGPDAPSQAIINAINEQVRNIENLNDAVADVAMAESVHQVVLGNYDRAAATMDTYSKGNFPPIPEVVQTPRSGINITHRFGLQFETNVDPAVSPNSMPVTPRSQGEPAINSWLNSVLPDEDDVAAIVSYFDHVSDTEKKEQITQKALDLQPIDLLYLVNTDNDQAMTALDDRIIKHIHDTFAPRPDAEIKIKYTERIPGRISFFELAAQMNSLRSLLLQSRPLEPMDVSLPTESKSAENESLFLDDTRIAVAKQGIENSRTDIGTYLGTLSPLVADPETNRAQLLSDIDTFITDLIDILARLSAYGLPQTGIGFAYDRRRVLYKAVAEKVEALIQRWEQRLTDFGTALTEYDNLDPTTPDEKRFELLYSAERLVTTLPESPQLPTPLEFRNKLTTKGNAFETKKDAFVAILNANHAKLADLIAAVNAELPIDDFDVDPMTLTDQEDQIVLFADELNTYAGLVDADLDKRTQKSQQLVDEAAALTASKKQVELLQDAGKQLFGADFKMVPEFDLPQKQADEWSNSFNDTGQLMDYLEHTAQVDFPLDEWRYGVARVREKIHHWENVVALREAFTTNTLEIHPVQLPYQENDSWLALDYPENHEILNDKILYTAHYAVPFDKTQRQCGLLLDEWTEVIPSKTEDVGVTFHYDRPNSEPPQVMLMAMTPRFTGEWQWNDLMDIVNETLDLAKKRALEPEQIDQTAYARFLPATVSSVTVHPITASLNYSFNNMIYNELDIDNNE